jgi:hypothetical protein
MASTPRDSRGNSAHADFLVAVKFVFSRAEVDCIETIEAIVE